MPDAGAGQARPLPSPLSRPEPGLPTESAHAQTAQIVTVDWPVIPSEVQPGRSFRLLFITSTKRSAVTSNIGDYNSFVQGRADAGHIDIQNFSGEFQALSSVTGAGARTRTGTTCTGVPIYWLGGAKVADDYADICDGGWDSWSAWNELDNGVFSQFGASVRTGSEDDGTVKDRLGEAGPTVGIVGATGGQTQEFDVMGAFADKPFSLIALSPVIMVSARPGRVMVDQATHNSIRVRRTPSRRRRWPGRSGASASARAGATPTTPAGSTVAPSGSVPGRASPRTSLPACPRARRSSACVCPRRAVGRDRPLRRCPGPCRVQHGPGQRAWRPGVAAGTPRNSQDPVGNCVERIGIRS